MPRPSPTGLNLDARFLWLVLPPALTLGAAAALLGQFGYPIHSLFDVGGYSGPAEAAARIKVLATWLPLALFGLVAILLFCWHLRQFNRASLIKLVAVYIMLSGIGLVFAANGRLEAHRYLGEEFVCQSFMALEPGQEPPLAAPPKEDAGSAASGAQKQADPRWLPKRFSEKADRLSETQSCESSRVWRMMSQLNAFQRFLLPLVTSALLLGMIGTLAIGPGFAFRRQAERLNTYLYLSSAVLVAGLLLLSALMRWPGYALPKDPHAIFEGHVSALVLYWGVVYSIYIAAAYLPAAWLLRQRQPDEASPPLTKVDDQAKASPNGPDDALLLDPFSMLKTAAAIFSPAIAALLSGALDI